MKRIALLLTVLFVTSWASAQDWYVTATVTQDHNIGEFKTLKDAYTEYPGGNIAIGDNFSRIIGARLSLGFNPMSGRTSTPKGRDIFERYHFYAATGFLDVTFNMVELFAHPSPNRRSAVYIFGGAGGMKTMMFEDKLNNHLWNDNYPAVDAKGGFYWAAHAGLAANIKLNRSFDLTIEGKYNFVPDEYNGVKYGTLDNYLELGLGVTWHFSQKRKVRTRNICEPIDELEAIWSLQPSNTDYSSAKPSKPAKTSKKEKKAEEPVIYDIPEPDEDAVVELKTPVEPKAEKVKEPKAKKEKAPKAKKVKADKPKKTKAPKATKVKEPKVKKEKAPKAEKPKKQKAPKADKPKKEKAPKAEKVKEPKVKKTKESKAGKTDSTSDKQAKEVFAPGERMQTAIYFIYSFTNVDINQHPSLEAVAKFLNDNPSARLIIHGYADREDGSATSNQSIAQARAEAVAAKLQRLHGIPATRLSISAHPTSLQGGVRGEDWIRAVEFEMAN